MGMAGGALQGGGPAPARGLAAVVLLSALLPAGAAAQPAPGAPDVSFGAGGQVQTLPPAAAATLAGDVAVDALGRILVAGATWDGGHEHLTVLRYLPNGQLDASFGAGGLVQLKTAPNSGSNRAHALVLQPDGKIVAVGLGLDPASGSDFGAAVVRCLPDGALDPEFGGVGFVVTRVGTQTLEAQAVALQPDGRIVVAGNTQGLTPTTGSDIVVLRYQPDGALDPAFGVSGVARLTIAGDQWARGVALTSSGRIVVSARTGNGTLLARLRSTGELDDTFGGATGVAGTLNVPGEGLALQADGKIVVPGMAQGGLGVARYASTGPLDPAFGAAGLAASGLSGVGDDAAVQENGRIVVAGRGGTFDQYPLLWRANADGSPDGTFGAIGPGAPGSPRSFFNAVTIQPDGKIVVAGRAGADADAFLVARYHGDPTDLIFKDGFDLGSLVAWSSSVTADANLAPDASVALQGTPFGLRAFVDEPMQLFVEDESPSDEERYRARFYLDAHDFDPGEALGHRRARAFVVFSENPGRRLAAIVLRRVKDAYSVMGRARLDDNTQADTGWTPIGPGPHRIELDLKRASDADANDGWFRLWVDGALVADLGALDNSRSAVDFVRLGALSVKGAAVGTLSWDQFESRRQGAIAP
jgi:uncharacterized delta-60 repeat protein